MRNPTKHSACFGRGLVLLTTGVLLATLVSLSACDSGASGTDVESNTIAQTQAVEETATDTAQELSYKVTVLDHTGSPMSNTVVKILKGGEEVKMNVTGPTGSVNFKLPADDYTVTFESSKGTFHWDTDACALTPNSPEIEIKLYPKTTDTMPLVAPDATIETDAEGNDKYIPQTVPVMGEGVYYCDLVGGDAMTYFVFVPTRGGTYEVSVTADEPADIGYYGMPIYVSSSKLLDTVDNKVEISISNGSVNTQNPSQTGQFVFGVKPESTSLTSCVITITRTGDPAKTLADEPWIEVKPTQAKAFEGQHGNTLVDIDVTKPNLTVVYNESDGYYHFGTSDGPVVFVRISSASPYLDSLVKISETNPIRAYIYDENGQFQRKESFASMLEAYVAVCDGNGVCPLTPEVEYMIKTFGNHQQWWNSSTDFSIFGDKIVPKDTAWLFLCCYYQ